MCEIILWKKWDWKWVLEKTELKQSDKNESSRPTYSSKGCRSTSTNTICNFLWLSCVCILTCNPPVPTLARKRSRIDGDKIGLQLKMTKDKVGGWLFNLGHISRDSPINKIYNFFLVTYYIKKNHSFSKFIFKKIHVKHALNNIQSQFDGHYL